MYDLFSYLLQVVSRAIACTVFTLAYTSYIFPVLLVHLMIIFVLKLKYEPTQLSDHKAKPKCGYHYIVSSSLHHWGLPLFTLKIPKLRFIWIKVGQYLYVFLGTLASTFIYIHLENPSESKHSNGHSTFKIQVWYHYYIFEIYRHIYK